jgi:hypothetical protein
MDIDLDELIQELNDREPCEVDYYSLRLIEKSASALSQLKTQLEEARQAKQNVCSLLDQALEQNERLKAELEEARRRAEIFYVERHHWYAKFQYLIKVLTRIHGFLLPNGVQLPDGRRFEFSNHDLERDMLRGLTAAIRAVPDELKKAEEQTSVGPWDAPRQPQGNDRRKAPWPDFKGQDIHECDVIKHPSGEMGVVVFMSSEAEPGDQWRVRYQDGTLSRLALQIGDKGMAEVVSRPPSP